MRVIFYGVRGGYPASGADFVGVGSHTTCLVVEAGEHRIIIDGGTGLAAFGRDLARRRGRGPSELILLLTHGHHDHLAGLPHFRPAFTKGTIVHAFGPPAMGTAAAVTRMFEPPWFPVRFDELPSRWLLRDLRETEALVLGRGASEVEVIESGRVEGRGTSEAVSIRPLRCYGHLRDGVYVYRLDHRGRSVVVATDVEAPQGGDRRLEEFARGADLLIHDAQYTEAQYLGGPTQGFGHSTPQMAAELAARAGVARLLLTHHAPDHDDRAIADLEDVARRIFPKTGAAREGDIIELRPSRERRR